MTVSQIYDQAHEPSGWMRERLRDTHDRIARGDVDPCPHHADSGQQHTFLRAPRHLLCLACLNDLEPVGGRNAKLCDRCGEPANRLHVTGGRLPHVFVWVLLCHDCYEKEMGA